MAFTISAMLTAQDNMSALLRNVNNELRNMETGGKQAGDGAKSAGAAMKDMADNVNDVIHLAMGFKFVQWGIELVQVGSQVNAVSATFEQLAGGQEAAAHALDLMRTSTRGVVDDLTLMSGANRLLMMGLAETAEEAAGLSQIAVTLGGAMGMDAAGSIENFGAAIANMSYERLDQLGISAGRVRDRVRELKEEGYATEDAFRMAVLEQGALAMDRLGDAAATSATGIATLQARWSNAMQSMGQATFQFVNQAAVNFNALTDQVVTIATLIDAQQGTQDFSSLGMNVVDGAPIWMRTFEGYDFTRGSDFMPSADRLRGEYTQAMSELASALELTPDIIGLDAASITDAIAAIDVNEIAVQASGLMEQVNAILDQGEVNVGAMFGDVHLFTPENAAQLQAEAEQVALVLERARGMHEQGLISDDELASIAQSADEAERLANAAQRGAEAFERMTLSQAFGQTGGGMAGEVTDDVVTAMQESGMSDEQIQQMQDAMDLASGRVTEASLVYRDEMMPMFAEMATQLSPEEMALAVQNLTETLQESAFQGLSSEQIAENMTAMTGFVETAEGTFEQIEDFDSATFVADLAAAQSSGTTLSSDIAIAARESSTLADNLRNLPTEHRMVLRVDMMLAGDLPPEVLSAIVGGAISNAGGVAPAADPRQQPAPVNGGFSPVRIP